MRRRWYLLITPLIIIVVIVCGLPLYAWWRAQPILVGSLSVEMIDTPIEKIPPHITAAGGPQVRFVEVEGAPITFRVRRIKTVNLLDWIGRLVGQGYLFDGGAVVYCSSVEERDGIGCFTQDEIKSLRWYNAPWYYWF